MRSCRTFRTRDRSVQRTQVRNIRTLWTHIFGSEVSRVRNVVGPKCTAVPNSKLSDYKECEYLFVLAVFKMQRIFVAIIHALIFFAKHWLTVHLATCDL